MNFFFSFAKEVASGGDSLLIKTRTYGRPYTTTIHPLTPFRLFYKLSGDCPAPGFSGARGHARKQDASGGERGYRQTNYVALTRTVGRARPSGVRRSTDGLFLAMQNNVQQPIEFAVG
ncbi:hypothetical protein QTP88_012215 [Uroleucon formosanum]